MCDHHSPADPQPRRGSRLGDGAAHTEDHRRWTRRSFLANLGLATAGAAFMLGRTPVQAYAHAPLSAKLQALETDRVLVLIQLSGGNDGLNTIIPVENDTYYNGRPSLAIAKSETLALTDELGMHPSFGALQSGYGDGRMAVVQNVGYPSPSLSHFRGTDIWTSASDSDETERTGWVGRYLDNAYPTFADDPPPHPLAVQIGGASLLFQGPSATMGMALASVELFERIAADGQLYDEAAVPATTYGTEMAFVRSVANASFRYADAVQTASNAGANDVAYPGGNPLARNLAVVARLIKGGLGARVYHVSLGSFDTHANQAGAHATLLRYLAEAVAAFQEDLGQGHADRTLTMTFSEFGRRPFENGSQGTDHGTAAPLFLFGDVEGGVYGSAPDLDDLDGGNLRFDTDFRAVYATVLQDWFGLAPADLAEVLGDGFAPLPLIADPAATGTDAPPLPAAFTLEQNYPNPFNPQTTIPFVLDAAGPVRLQVFDVRGRLVQTLVDGSLAGGGHRVRFDAGRLPSGTYLYRLQTAAGTQSQTMTLVR